MIAGVRSWGIKLIVLLVVIVPSRVKADSQVRIFRTAAGYRVTAGLPGLGNRYEFVFNDQAAPGQWRGEQRRRGGHARGPWHGAALSITDRGFSLHLFERRRFRPITLSKAAAGHTRVIRALSHSKRSCALRDEAQITSRTLTVEPAATRISPPRELSVFVVSEPGALFQGVQTARELLNAADALYASQLGLRLKLAGFRALTSAAPASEELAETLEQFRSSAPLRSWFGRANAYLFLTAPRSNREVIGLSYLGYLCQDNGQLSFATAQRVEGPLQPLVIAHELAHLFGVGHDSDPNSLMSARIGASSSTLSAQSRARFAQYIAEHGSCLPEAPRTTIVMKSAVQTRSTSLTLAVAAEEPGPCAIRIAAASSVVGLSRPDGPNAVVLWEGGVESTGGFASKILRFAANRLVVPRAGASLFARAFTSCGSGDAAASEIALLSWRGTNPSAAKAPAFNVRFLERLVARLKRVG